MTSRNPDKPTPPNPQTRVEPCDHQPGGALVGGVAGVAVETGGPTLSRLFGFVAEGIVRNAVEEELPTL
jgi:hypothetical protein